MPNETKNILEDIIPSIIPDNILEIQLLKDSLDIFLEYLVENSDISQDIKNIFDENKVPIYEEFVQIYLNNIYTVLSQSEHNERLYSKLKNMYEAIGKNVDNIDMTIDILGLLTKEYLITNKEYKSSKGTPKGMEYIYNIIIRAGFQYDYFGPIEGQFTYLEEGNLFEYIIEGTMLAEVYEAFVKPLAHPVGWKYIYRRVLYMSFVDYFDLEFIYTFRALEVRCMNGFNLTKDDYMNNISHTGEKLLDDDDYVVFVQNEDIKLDGFNTSRKRTVFYNSGKYIVSKEEPRSLIFYDSKPRDITYSLFPNNTDTDTLYSIDANTGIISFTSIGADYYNAGNTMPNFIITSTSSNGNSISIRSDGKYVENTNGIWKVIKDNPKFNTTFKFEEGYDSNNIPEEGFIYCTVHSIETDGTILLNYDNYDGNCGLYIDYDVSTKTTVKDDMNFERDMPAASTTGKLNAIGAGNTFIGSFVVGDKLVNKNVSVTYQTVTGQFDGNYHDTYDVIPALDDNTNLDNGGTFDTEAPVNSPINKNNLYYDGSNIINRFAATGLKGSTAIDEYSWEQVLVLVPNVELEFNDSIEKDIFWDKRRLYFDYFTFDDFWISDEFEIEQFYLGDPPELPQ